ncbi:MULTISPECIES: AAA family ATPase [unclassified Sphingobacterium]|uniref:AAA family ATPase n=1 Tax=unclassified Sphingobacterium TaxID=2609468 RepID=UPI0020C294E9|nr:MULTISPECIES: AAA family ATPase [unclassified Sphingobacterium]
MKLKHISDYLSIKKFNDIEISDFTVITGINGAGKSHFLNAIDKGNITIEGIDSENIILYNYNDFNVYNIDLNYRDSQTSSIKQRQQAYIDKSNSSNVKFQEKRNNIISSFKVNRNYGSIYLDEDLIYNMQNLGLLDWSDEDKDYYLTFDMNNPDTSKVDYYKFVNFQSLISRYEVHNIEDLDKFIEFFKDTTSKVQALTIIRNYGYSKELKSLNETKFQEVFDVIRLTPPFDFGDVEIRNKYPHFILDIIYYLRDSTQFFNSINPTQFVKDLKEVYKEVEEYYKSQLDEYTLKQIQSVNGDNVLDSISFDNGFFNLHDIAQEEKSFQLIIKQNDINKFLKSEGQYVHTFTNEELKDNFGESPIKILNDILNEYDVNGYEFRNSELHLDIHNGMLNQNIHVYLFNKTENFQTHLDALSSGEKTLLALAFSVYKLTKKKVIAKVLLLDELDSALHPSMSKRLINVLHNYFHKVLGIKIIISSHSPSTIAFSPDDSLYIIKKGDSEKLLHHVSKDEALKELTIGVPSFSINYENRKQVFVESKYDVEYYSAINDIFKDYLNKEISLNFIASGDVQKDKNGQPKSNCDVVKEIAKTLRKAGNNSIYGIIDWDLAKSKDENSYIITLGYNSRYSIENYIFDPLFVGVFLLKEKIIKPDYFGFDDKFSLQSLLNLTKDQCQTIINKICERIKDEITQEKIISVINDSYPGTIMDTNFSELNSYKTIHGLELQIPYFIKVLQGHKLEEYLTEIFPKFKAYSKGREDLLKKEFIKIVMEDFINYTPSDLLDVLLEAQK